MKRVKLSSAVRSLADYVADFGDETVVSTEGNRAIAAIVPLKNVDRESLALSQHPEFLELPRPLPGGVRCWSDHLTWQDEASRPDQAVAEQTHAAAARLARRG